MARPSASPWLRWLGSLATLVFASLATPALAEASASSGLEGRKISAVTALLPPRTGRGAGATLRLEAFGGCYQWSSQQPNLVRIEMPRPLEPKAEALECMERKALECMDRGPVLGRELFGAKMDESEVSCQPVAILRSVAEDVVGTEKVVIFARDMGSPHVELRCEVYLAHVDRIEVETSVRRINVDDAETVTAKAFDSSGNVFSSLEGVEFKWEVSDPSVLREPPAVETAFKLSPERRALALGGMQSDTMLLYGVATGRASVTARLLSTSSSALVSPAVQLTVAENLFVLPSTARVPPMSHLQLQLKVLRGASRPLEQIPEVALPVKYLEWDWQAVEGGTNVLHVPGDTGAVIVQQLGRARVVVRDLRIENNSASSLIDVVEPAQLRVRPLPLGNTSGAVNEWEKTQLRLSNADQWMPLGGPTSWYFVQGRTYILRLELLDATSQAMHIPTNFRATMRCKASEGPEEPSPLQIIQQIPSSALAVVSAEVVGTGLLTYGNVSVQADASDTSRGLSTREWPNLRLEQLFHVVAPLQLLSPFPGPLVLPPLHSYRLRISGGSGTHIFTLTNVKPQGACTVSSTGLVQAAGLVGSAELFVSDARNIANNLTVQIIVRRAGGLALRPPQLQLQLRPENGVTDEASEHFVPASYSVPVLGRPEASMSDLGESAAWKALRFWNCSSLQLDLGYRSAADLSEALITESSEPRIAEAYTVAQAGREISEEGVCAVISVVPRSPGPFTLSTRLSRSPAAMAGRGERLTAAVDLQVYSPLELAYEGIPKAPASAAGLGAAENAVLLAPCSALRLRLLHGPGEMQVPGRPFRNLTSPLQGTHLRLRRLDTGSFEVVCLRPTPGPARLVAEVRHEPDDREAHGGPVVARGNSWIWCVPPYSTEIVPASPSPDVELLQASASTSDNGTSVGLRRGHTHRFEVRFFNSEGRLIMNASEFQPHWSLEGAPQGQTWLASDGKGPAAAVTAPASTAEGTVLYLRAAVALPGSERCAAANGLDSPQQALTQEALAGLSAPLPDVISLRATTDIEVRWPGYPSRHFTYAPQWAYVFEVSQGSGSSQLTVGDTTVAEAVELSDLCGGLAGDNASGCFAAAHAEVLTAGAARWPVRPVVPGYSQLTFVDKGQLGSAPKVVHASFFPIGRLSIALSDIDAPSSGDLPSLLIRGHTHALRVEVWDTENNPLPPSSWQPARLRVEASGQGLEVVPGPELGSFSVVGRVAGAFKLQALAYNHPSAVLYSNTLHIHVFETFGIEPKDMVVLPGQTFEIAVQGGPTASTAWSAHVSFASSSSRVADVHPTAGLLTARRSGRASVSAQLVDAATGRQLAHAEANVSVVVPDAVSIHLVQLGASALSTEKARQLALVRGASDPLRLAALLTGQGLPLSLPLLTIPTGAAREGRGQEHGCVFKWNASEQWISLSPAASLGKVAVDLFAARAADDSFSGKSVVISVEVQCPGAPKLKASQQLTVLEPLLLVAPTLPPASAAAGAPTFVALPPLGRVPLVFNRPREHLQIELRAAGGSAVGGRLTAELVDSGSAVELVAGQDEGEALLVVEDPRSDSLMSPLLISVAVRRPRSLLVETRPRRLPLHATADCRLLLTDAYGMALALPTNYLVTHYVSHPSVLGSELVQTAHGETLLRLRAAKEGCVAAGVEVKTPEPLPAVSAAAEALAICVGPSALVGRGPLLLQPGAVLQLPVENAVLGPEDSQALTFTLRLACPLGSSPHSSEELAEDIAKALRLPSQAVRAIDSRWAPSSPGACGSASALDVDLEVSGERLPGSFGLGELADALWFPSCPPDSGQALGCLDRSFGLRASRAAPRAGWSSLRPAVLEADASGAAAAARQPGSAVATFSFAGVSGALEVEVARVAEVVLEQPSGTPLVQVTDGEGEVRSFLANVFGRGSLVVPVRFFAAGVEGGLGEMREFRSGPFQLQNFDFACVPGEPELGDFFEFRSWSLANISAVQEDMGEESPLPALAASSPQAACVLRPKRVDARRWAERLPPRMAELKVSLKSFDAGPGDRPGVHAAAQWPFLPQFAPMDDAGKQLSSGDVCAVVTPSKPVVSAWVWTGGQPIEASLERQLGDAQHGWLSLHVHSSPPSSMVPTASMSVTISWESAVEWPGMEELILRLESRTSGQVERLRIRVQGAPHSEAPAPAPQGSWLMALLARGGPLLLLLSFCWRCTVGGTRQRQAPPPAPAVGGLFGPADAWQQQGPAPHTPQRAASLAFGTSPFQRIELHH